MYATTYHIDTTFIALLAVFIFILRNTNGIEEIAITASGTYACTTSEIKCTMTIANSCSAECDHSTYNCPSTPSCQLCELVVRGGDYSAQDGVLYSNQCDTVNVLLNSTGYRTMKGM